MDFVKYNINIKNLTSQGFVCVDAHFHTIFSDGSAKIHSVLKKCQELGIGVGITDHNTARGALAAWHNREGVFIVPGIEVTSRDCKDLIFYFYDPKELHIFNDIIERSRRPNIGFHLNKTNLSIGEILDISDGFNCVVSLPHPFCHHMKESHSFFHEKEAFIKRIHALEIVNGMVSPECNSKAQAWNRILKKGVVGGSDGHTLGQLGHVLTISKADTLEEFLNNIKKKKSYVFASTPSPLQSILSQAVLVKNNTRLGIRDWLFG